MRKPVEKITEGIPRNQVNYRTSSDQTFRCAGCTFYAAAENLCSRVAPPDVSPDGLCDLFKLHPALRPDLGGGYVAEAGRTKRPPQGEPLSPQKVEPHTFLRLSDEDRYTLGVVYEPDTDDAQGHFASARTIELAAWEFMAGRPEAGVMHLDGAAGPAVGVVVESYIHRGPDWTVRLADGREATVRTGSWLLGVRWSEEVWRRIRSGELTGLSLQGRARLRPAS